VSILINSPGYVKMRSLEDLFLKAKASLPLCDSPQDLERDVKCVRPCQREDLMPTGKKFDFTAATARARHIRELYKQLEERLHGSAWTPQEMMLGYLYDIGELGRMVMAGEDRWLHEGDLPKRITRQALGVPLVGVGPCRSFGS
jgi:hypothetical protein